jgi:hypothetical protein
MRNTDEDGGAIGVLIINTVGDAFSGLRSVSLGGRTPFSWRRTALSLRGTRAWRRLES